MKQLNVISISHVMPSGSVFLHSLFDSHPEVVTMPGYTDIFSIFNYSFDTPKKALELFNKYNPDFYDTSSQTIAKPGYGGLDTLGETANEGIITPEKEFKLHFLNCISNNELTPKNIILSIHYAYAKSHDLDIHDRKVIVMHPHYHDKAIFLHGIFGNTKCIVTVRHPVQTYFSCIKRTVDKAKIRGKCFNHASSYLYRESIGVAPLIDNNIKLKIVRIEDFEDNIEFIMRHLCKFIGIKYNGVLAQSTFGSKKYWGANPLYKVNAFSSSRHKSRNKITYVEENIFYLAFKKYCDSLGYELIKPKKYLSFFCIFTVFFPMKYDIYWLKNNFFMSKNHSYDRLWNNSLHDNCITRFQVIMSLLKERALIIKKYFFDFFPSNSTDTIIKESFVKVVK